MVTFPETLVRFLVWGCLGLTLIDVVLLSSLWVKDARGGKLW
jgi:hypothetical protein